jgi:hypothetical protein
MTNISIREYKIKTISYFFKGEHNEEISNKVLSIIDNYELEYTVNNNGIFINLNVIDNFLLDIIYDCIETNNTLLNNSDDNTNNELFDNINIPIINNSVFKEFVKSPDSIKYTTIDKEVLSLSKKILTI